MEHDAVFFVDPREETTKCSTEHTSKRMRVGRNDVDLEVSSDQRGGHLESDEACPDHDGTPGRRPRDDGTAVRHERR